MIECEQRASRGRVPEAARAAYLEVEDDGLAVSGDDQNRIIPNRSSSATVMKPEISSEPRHPSRFEKKKNMRCPP